MILRLPADFPFLVAFAQKASQTKYADPQYEDHAVSASLYKRQTLNWLVVMVVVSSSICPRQMHEVG